jgi:Flp pilus assembly protein TadB
MTSPLLIAIVFSLGLAILAFLALPGRQRIRFSEPGSRLNLRERLVNGLREAGIFDQSPSIFLLIGIGLSVVISALLWFLLGNLAYIVFGPLLVYVGFRVFINSRQRRFQTQTYEELIPFLNRISTAVRAGLPIQSAYLQAVEDSQALKPVLSDSAAKISAGAEFIPSLVETIPLLPLRMWATFVRQLELHQEVGGDLAKALQTTTDQLGKMQRLQAETRADFSMQQKQQRLIMGIVGFGIFAMFFLLPGGGERFAATFSSPLGIGMNIFGIGVMVAGVVFLNKQLKDIDRKLNA